jgi:hypothetical protein
MTPSLLWSFVLRDLCDLVWIASPDRILHTEIAKVTKTDFGLEDPFASVVIRSS